jgi:hypothetical protein
VPCKGRSLGQRTKAREPLPCTLNLSKSFAGVLAEELESYEEIHAIRRRQNQQYYCSLRWIFVAKRASQIIVLKGRTDFRGPAEFWQPLVHPAGSFRTSQPSGRRFREPRPEFELAPWEQVLWE